MSSKKPIWIVIIVLSAIAIVLFVIIAIKMSAPETDEITEATVVDDITTASHITETTAETAITTTSPETEPEAITATSPETERIDEPLWNVSPIDRINVDPLPEDAYYSFRYGSQITINTYSDNWYCYFNAYKISEEDESIEKIADDSIAFIKDLHDWQNYTFVPEEPVKLKVGGYDAVLYKTELYSNYGGDPYLVEESRLYYIKSKTGVFEFDFRCENNNLSECEADWDYIISNVKIDDELKPEDVTTIFVSLTATH
jgi:hypothetical protein